MTHTRALKIHKKLVKNTAKKGGKTYQVFGVKPYYVTIIRTGFCFQHRRFSKLSHSPASTPCAADVAFCLHVANWRLWCLSKQLLMGASSD